MCIHREIKLSDPRPHLVVFTGAGISAESGMPTYRGENGLWNQPELAELMSVGGYYEKPEKVLDVLNAMRLKCSQAQPNNAHCKLAELESEYRVTIITQNVDDLHERAGSKNVLHIHGKLSEVTSSENRCDFECITEYPLDKPIKLGDKAKDGSQLRPNVVLFGEYLSDFHKAADIVRTADIFLVIGTSLNVFPASRLINYVPADVPRYIIDPDATITNELENYNLIQAPASEGIENFFEILTSDN